MSRHATEAIPKLTDDNYYTWSYEMEMLLASKGLWNHCLTDVQQIQELKEFIKMELPEAEEDKIEELALQRLPKKDVTWMSRDKKCIALIGMHVDAKFIPIVKSQKFARQNSRKRVILIRAIIISAVYRII